MIVLGQVVIAISEAEQFGAYLSRAHSTRNVPDFFGGLAVLFRGRVLRVLHTLARAQDENAVATISCSGSFRDTDPRLTNVTPRDIVGALYRYSLTMSVRPSVHRQTVGSEALSRAPGLLPLQPAPLPLEPGFVHVKGAPDMPQIARRSGRRRGAGRGPSGCTKSISTATACMRALGASGRCGVEADAFWNTGDIRLMNTLKLSSRMAEAARGFHGFFGIVWQLSSDRRYRDTVPVVCRHWRQPLL
jgi:hypothetical protein